MISYIIGFSTFIFGKTEFAVRFGSVILYFFDGFLIYYLSCILFNNKRASFIAFLFFLSSVIFDMVLSVMALPDAPLIFFYLCFLILFYKATEHGNESPVEGSAGSGGMGLWILAGIALGFAFLSKYTAALIPPLALIYLLVSGKNRKFLKTVYPYLSLFIALLVFAPVIYWNAAHGFVSFRFQLSHGFSSPKPGIVPLMQGFFGQVLVITPFIYIFLLFCFIYSALLLLKIIKFPFGRKISGNNSFFRQPVLFALVMSLPILLFFIIDGYSHKILLHWPDIGYLSAFPVMGFVADGFLSGTGEKVSGSHLLKSAAGKIKAFFIKYYVYFAIFAGFFLSFILYNQIYYNSIPVGKIIKYVNREKDLKKGGLFSLIPYIRGNASTADITNDLFGWPEAAKYVGIIYRNYHSVYPGTFLLTHQYSIADELVFYGGYIPAKNIFNISGFLNQDDLWQNLMDVNGKDAIFIMDNKYMINPVKTYKGYFNSIKSIGRLNIYVKFHLVRIYYLYFAKDFDASKAIRDIKKRMY